MILSLSSYLTKRLGPILLRHSLTARFLLRSDPNTPFLQENTTLDSVTLLFLAQRLVSLDLREEYEKQKRNNDNKNYHKKTYPNQLLQKFHQSLDQFVDWAWDRFIEPRFYPSHTGNQSLTNNTNTGGKQYSTPPVAFSKIDTDVQRRLDVFEQYVRPILVPHETWQDIMRWKYHSQLMKWVRREYLFAKYGIIVQEALRLYPILRPSSIESPKRMMALPSSKTLVKALNMGNWNRTKDLSSESRYMKHIITDLLGGDIVTVSQRNNQIVTVPTHDPTIAVTTTSTTAHSTAVVELPLLPLDTSVAHLTMEQILEIAGSQIMECGPFNSFCEEVNIFQYWTKEYVSALASYLLQRSWEFHQSNHGKDTIILEVGAGDGTLATYLRESLEIERQKQRKRISSYGPSNQLSRSKRKMDASRFSLETESTMSSSSFPLPTVIAIDDGSWKIKSLPIVEKSTVLNAMKKYSPWELMDNQGAALESTVINLAEDKNVQRKHQLIVLCSWMPMGTDWSKYMRMYGADEYVLIGECDDGSCGDNWHTWGNPDFFSSSTESTETTTGTASKAVGVNEYINSTQILPPHEKDNYFRVDLNDLSQLQYSRFDTSLSCSGKTVSFRRNDNFFRKG